MSVSDAEYSPSKGARVRTLPQQVCQGACTPPASVPGCRHSLSKCARVHTPSKCDRVQAHPQQVCQGVHISSASVSGHTHTPSKCVGCMHTPSKCVRVHISSQQVCQGARTPPESVPGCTHTPSKCARVHTHHHSLAWTQVILANILERAERAWNSTGGR